MITKIRKFRWPQRTYGSATSSNCQIAVPYNGDTTPPWLSGTDEQLRPLALPSRICAACSMTNFSLEEAIASGVSCTCSPELPPWRICTGVMSPPTCIGCLCV